MAIGTTIPIDIIKRIIPPIMEQTTQLSKFAQNLKDKCQMLPKNIKCEDPRVQQLIDELKKIQQAIESLKRLLEIINRIIPTMQNVGIVAQVLKIVQLAIPSVPGVPGGPVAEFIRIFSAIIDNLKSAIESLKGLLDTVNTNLDDINSMIGKSIDTLGSICNNEIFDITQEVSNIIDQLNDINNLPRQNLSGALPSEFYQDINVSEEDISNRLQLIEELVEQQRDLLLSIKEAPSQVINQSGVPDNSIGDIGDYYIDSTTNSVYGPKSDTGWKISTINL